MTTTTPEFPPSAFKTSTYTADNGTCVEAATSSGVVAIQDTKSRSTGRVIVPAGSFASMIAALKNDDLHTPA